MMSAALRCTNFRETLKPLAARLCAATAGLVLTSVATAEELNALVWCDHTDPELIQPFENEHGVRVNLKEYEGTGSALAIVEQSQPGDWDLFVVDAIEVPRIVEAGLLSPLPTDQLPVDDIFEGVRFEDNVYKDGKMYAIVEKFGYNVISYNSEKVDPADMRDLDKLWSDEYKGRIAIYDYYLPAIGLVGYKLGIKPSEITADNLPEIRDALFALKDNASMVGEVVASTTALATGEADVLFGGGEWAVAVLMDEQPEMNWVLPDQGGILWAQSIGVFETSERKDLALKFVKYIMSPEGQARLATSSCFWGMPANRKAGEFLPDEHKKHLRWDEQAEFIAKSDPYPIVGPELDAQMLEVWTEFLQH